ncbi:copper amine oxidase [Aeromicrobium sp. P5_D10]
MSKRLKSTLLWAIVGTLVAATLGSTGTATAAEDDPLSCGTAAVQRTLPNGASWRMCARIHPIKGLVLEQVEFKPASGTREYEGYLRVLDELYLSQLNVPYDTGYAQFNDITSFGFGNQYLQSQTDKTCTGDAVQIEQAFTYAGRLLQRTIPGICLAEIKTGLATHSSEDQLGGKTRIASQGAALEVSSLSKIAWYEYQERVVFDENGGIDVGLGATGDLAPDSAGGPFFSEDPGTGWPLGGPPVSEGIQTHGASHWHSAIWRVDFGIGGAANQFVEQWDYEVTEQEGAAAPITRGVGTRKDRAFSSVGGDGRDPLSWWRVGSDASRNPDDHARSYEIVNNNVPNESIAVTQPILTVINERECAEYASENINPGCAGDSILDYVAADSASLIDPIAWVNVGFHHVDRDEDQSPMPMHWQRFQLVPRDFFAQSPSVDDARVCINGAVGDIDSVEQPCIATNVTRPRITSNNNPVAVGAQLSTTKGLWVENRTKWNYDYMWFRNGEPIVTMVDGEPEPATGPTYVVSEADLGKEVTVKVTASQRGFLSGVAESRPLVIPGGPTPSPTPTATSSPTPTSTPPTTRPTPQRARSWISTSKTKSVKSNKRATMTVRVRVAKGTPSGKVTVKRGSKRFSGWLKNGVVTLKTPRIKKTGSYRFSISYAGSKYVLPSKGTMVLKVKKR